MQKIDVAGSVTPFAPRPVRKPVMLQEWQNLTFIHWSYPAAQLVSLLPSGLTLDTFHGAAWVGLTPFRLANLRIPGTPPLPWLSTFAETNVRTYVRGPDGEPGVWFFTLEASRLAAVVGARLTYRLPYRWSWMRVRGLNGRFEYRSRRKWPFGRGSTDIAVETGAPIAAMDFDNFLTARYRLYSLVGARVAFADIEHPPWPLHRARILRLNQDLVMNSGVPTPAGDPVVHHCTTIQVKIGRLQLYR